MDLTDIMSSEFHWAKLVLGVTVGVVVNAFFVACYFRKKMKDKTEKETTEQDIEIIPPLEDDTLGVIDKYEKLHGERKRSYTTEKKSEPYTLDPEGSSANLDILEQQLFENVQGTNLARADQRITQRTVDNLSSNQDANTVESNLGGAIRQQVHRCHTAIVHLQNRLQNESSKRQQAEEWCSMLEKELTAHLGARQAAETKCEKLNQRIRLLSRKLKSQERILRKRQKEVRQNSSTENQNIQVAQSHSNGHAEAELYTTEIEVANATPSGGGQEYSGEVTLNLQSAVDRNDNSDDEEEVCDVHTNSYTSYVDDDEPHFASDLDEEKIVEPQELQKIIEAVDEASDDEDAQHKSDSEDESVEDIDFESDEEEPRSADGRAEEGSGFEIENDVMHQLVANAVCGDLNDLLSADQEESDEDSLSDLVAANMSENNEDDENKDEHDSTLDSFIYDMSEGDISSESIGNTKSTREFWERKVTEQEEQPKDSPEVIVNEHLEKIKRSSNIRRGGSFRDPPRVSKIPILKPSGKKYSQEAESVHTRSMNPEIRQHGSENVEGTKLSIEAMREHWEKNQRKWGSSHVINTENDGSTGSEGDSGNENGNLVEIERSADFKDLKEQWKKKNADRLGRPENATDINENMKIERDRSPGFQALKDEWESKTQDPDESL